jgi:hypothetical protein
MFVLLLASWRRSANLYEAAGSTASRLAGLLVDHPAAARSMILLAFRRLDAVKAVRSSSS